ncbi:hypothetical protein M942_08635 [Enterobacter ludwigii]|jgi:hypothetical protein|uniref:DUF2635 domain-containing protein n=1 Tax=Enterobacter ludwigii TaxID=299767 RepID=UPI0003D95E1A|nr:DUF2635 domain-containing protein [Enterobacter ludwigii]AHE72792.1 hypothetical protein M942_08635 [Enterobacter ludwigii]
MFVKPAPGRMIRHPDKGTFLPENGAEVPDNAIFWRNRLRDGDVIRAGKSKPSASTGKQSGKSAGEPGKEPDA